MRRESVRGLGWAAGLGNATARVSSPCATVAPQLRALWFESAPVWGACNDLDCHKGLGVRFEGGMDRQIGQQAGHGKVSVRVAAAHFEKFYRADFFWEFRQMDFSKLSGMAPADNL